MASYPSVILRQGYKKLDLMSGRYQLKDFVPPSANITPLLSGGTSANRYGGSSKVGERANDREWTFTVRVSGASTAECMQGGVILANFLAMATRDNPVFLEYRPDSNIASEPIWGQRGANQRYEIIHSQPPQAWEQVLAGRIRDKVIVYSVTCTVKPFALGKRQRLTSAIGGILDDNIGMSDGRTRGLHIPEATTNKMTNPVFSHGTWNNGWTAGSAVVATQNTDTDYILWGYTSAKLVSRSTVNNTFTQSIAAGNTNTHFITAWIKCPDSAEVTAGEFDIYYDGTAYPTGVQSLGNGFYRLGASVTAVAGATTVGLDLQVDRSVYLCGMQFEEKSYGTELCYGDLLGCAWSGTAHASTSTRTAARLRLTVADETFHLGQGTIRTVWRCPFWEVTTTVTLWDTGEYKLTYVGASNIFRLTDGTNIISTGVVTLPQDGSTPFVIHCIWSESGISIAVNGTVSTNTAITIPTARTYVYIGCDTSAATHCNGTIMEFAIYDRAITSSEVTADYNNIVQVTNDLDIGGYIPWLWTKDGDDVVDNCNDSSRDNFMVIGGIPGDAPAETLIGCQTSSTFVTFGSVYLSNMGLTRFVSPTSLLYCDLSGTVDASASGGEVRAVSLGTSEANLSTTFAVTRAENLDDLLDRDFIMLARLIDAGSGLQLRAYYTVSTAFGGEFKSVTGHASNYYLFETNPLFIPSNKTLFYDRKVSTPTVQLAIRGKRVTGSSTANVTIDYFDIFPYPYIKITGGGGGDAGFMYQGNRAAGLTTTTYPDSVGALSNLGLVVYGAKPIELLPKRLNLVQQLLGDATHAPAITVTSTYTIYVSPRYAL